MGSDREVGGRGTCRLRTGWVLEHWHTGTLTRRVPELHRAGPAAQVWLSAEDAKALGVKAGDLVRVTSRRGQIRARVEVGNRNTMPKGMVYVPFFDESVDQRARPFPAERKS